MRRLFATAEEAQNTLAFIEPLGGNSTWDRLAEYLQKELSDRDIFVINRSCNLPIETTFDMWTKSKHLAQWLPPTGFTMQFRRIDIRTGGHKFYAMTNGTFTMYGRIEHLHIRRPDRIKYTQSFSDENENISPHPRAPVWPDKMLSTVLLTAEVAAQTRVSVSSKACGTATPEEVAAFVDERAGFDLALYGGHANDDVMPVYRSETNFRQLSTVASAATNRV